MDTPTTNRGNRPGHGHVQFRTRFIPAILLALLLGITAVVLRFLYTMTAGLLAPLTVNCAGRLPAAGTAVLSIALVASSAYLIGLIATHVLGKQLISMLKKIIAATKPIPTFAFSQPPPADRVHRAGSQDADEVKMVIPGDLSRPPQLLMPVHLPDPPPPV